LAVVLVVILVGVGFILVVRSNRSSQIGEVVNIAALRSDDHVEGNVNAPIQLFVYTDTECPYCKRFQQSSLPLLQSEFGSSLLVIYRDFPLDNIHPLARHEMEGAECAALQGGNTAYFNFVNAIFVETHSNETFPTSELPVIATRIGLNTAKFNTCLSSGETKARVQRDVADGEVAGLNETPSIVVEVNGQRILIAGDYYAQVRVAIYDLTGASGISIQ
jgi:protein-disulfide isomerase